MPNQQGYKETSQNDIVTCIHSHTVNEYREYFIDKCFKPLDLF